MKATHLLVNYGNQKIGKTYTSILIILISISFVTLNAINYQRVLLNKYFTFISDKRLLNRYDYINTQDNTSIKGIVDTFNENGGGNIIWLENTRDLINYVPKQFIGEKLPVSDSLLEEKNHSYLNTILSKNYKYLIGFESRTNKIDKILQENEYHKYFVTGPQSASLAIYIK